VSEDGVSPGLEWARRVAGAHNLATRCPYSASTRCPRYYESVSLLASTGITTSLPPDMDAQLLAKWRKSELWPLLLEDATAVSGSGEAQSYTNFCPEVAYDRFGYFATSLLPYHDDIDHEAGLAAWARRPVEPDHWHTTWSYVHKLHYSDCRLYNLLKAESVPVPTPTVNAGLVRKIAVLCKDYYSLRTIDDIFVFAGAEPNDWAEPSRDFGSQRMDQVYGWVEGLSAAAPTSLDEILVGVTSQLAENEAIPAGDRAFLVRHGAVASRATPPTASPQMPTSVEELLERLVQGLPRAMRPLRHRRKGASTLGFSDEYDVQSLFHALIAPWVNDIRAEE
jgi:hypothetical protein